MLYICEEVLMMDIIYSPWRAEYILGGDETKKENECFLCNYPTFNDDEKYLLIARGKSCFVIMNKFPYNPGHLMVAPYRHTADFGGLSGEEAAELMSLAQKAQRVLAEVMTPQGFNLGMNLGRIAGAGVADHLHLHVVPRWAGDTNFMPVLGKVRVISEALDLTRKRIAAAWTK